MKDGLTAGLRKEVTFIVTEEMCPAIDGRVVHRVCATWTVVQYMEIAGRMIVGDFLEPGEESIGNHASCDHHAPAPLGAEVLIVAAVDRVHNREVECSTTAFVGGRAIATGLTRQKVIPTDVLDRLLRRTMT